MSTQLKPFALAYFFMAVGVGVSSAPNNPYGMVIAGLLGLIVGLTCRSMTIWAARDLS